MKRRGSISLEHSFWAILLFVIALFAASCSDERLPLCEVRLGTATPKNITSILYGPVDYNNLDIDDYQIFYRATPLDNVEMAYGSTGDDFLKLASSQDPFVLSQGKWRIEIHLLPTTVTETTIHKDEIISETVLFGELETWINLNTGVLKIPCGFPTQGRGKLFLAYSTPISSQKENPQYDITFTGDSLTAADVTIAGGKNYTVNNGTVTYTGKSLDVSLYKMIDGSFVPVCVYYPDKKVTFDEKGDPVEESGTFLQMSETGASCVWQFVAQDNELELDVGFYIIAIHDLNTELTAKVEAKKYYNKSGSKYVPKLTNGEYTIDYTISDVVDASRYLDSIYGETISVFVAPSMTTIVKGNTEYAADVIQVDADTTGLNHDCNHTDIHYYVNQYGAYCSYCLKGNDQAKDAAITSHQYFYKRSDGVYCVVDLPSIPLSPESKDSATKLTYAWEGYDNAKAVAKKDYEDGGYRLCSFKTSTGYTTLYSEAGTRSYLTADGQFFFFLNFDGTLASFSAEFDSKLESFTNTNTSYSFNDTANQAGANYAYLYNSWNTSLIHATSIQNVNTYMCLNSRGIYEYTKTTTSDTTAFTYDINAVKRALEAGQKYCIMFVNRYQTTNGKQGSTFTGRTLVGINYKSVSGTIDQGHALYDDIMTVPSADREFIWEATADWEVYSLLDRYNGEVSSNALSNGAAMTAFAKTGADRTVGFTFFMSGSADTVDKTAGLSHPRPDKNAQRWEFFIDNNRDVILVGMDESYPFTAEKYATLFVRPYFKFYETTSWGDTGNLAKDGRYVAVLSPLITSYVAGAHGKDYYVSTNVSPWTADTPTKKPNEEVVGNVATFGSGSSLVVVSMNETGDAEARSAAASVGFYINHLSEVVSAGNDAKAKQWATDAGCVYYIDKNNQYVTIERDDLALDNLYYNPSDKKTSLFDVWTISSDLLTRIAAIRNAGATYYFDKDGNYVKTGYRNHVFHLADAN